ncbi:MAG: hypothetical protein GC189_09885 [Alphaproteobacteria bacterium]|nr:hypothetical protein [Alphaproteobacteria bacterium]
MRRREGRVRFVSLILKLCLGLTLCAAPAWADDLVLDASAGAPVIETEINGRPVRLLVDTRLPDIAVINPAAAQRLRLRRVPLTSAAVGLDGESVLQGRIARPSIRFANGEQKRLLAGLFGVNAAARADGVIGPGGLPYDHVTIALRQGPRAAHAHVIALRTADVWEWRETIAGVDMTITFDVDRRETVFSRRAAERLVAHGTLAPHGAVSSMPFIIGVSITAQPVTAREGFSVSGFAPGPALAHTSQPLSVPQDADAIIVTGQSENEQPPPVNIGRAALSACSHIVSDREAKTLTVYCD